jgi:hypothetical protein
MVDRSLRERRSLRKNVRRPSAEPDPDALTRTEAALAIWQASKPAEGTPAETYLQSRGLNLSSRGAIRFHAGLKHPGGGIVRIGLAVGFQRVGADDLGASTGTVLLTPNERRVAEDRRD